MEAIGTHYIIKEIAQEETTSGFKVINSNDSIVRGEVISGERFTGLIIIFDKKNAIQYKDFLIVDFEDLLAIV